MTREQRWALLGQIRRNWRHKSCYTAVYQDGERLRTIALDSPMLADERDLVAVTDGQLSFEEFQQMVGL